MSEQSQVSDAEVEAIMDLVRPAVEAAAQVVPRDFKAPRRLSQAQLDALARRVDKVMVDVSTHLSSWLRSSHRARVADVVEAHQLVLIDGFVEPMRALAFNVGTQLGFVVWDLGAMTTAIEAALGSSDPKTAVARPLTRVEERILSELLCRCVSLIGGALGVEVGNFRVLRERTELAQAEDAGSSDPQRIGVCIALQGAAGDSTLRFYFPAVKAPESARSGAPAKDSKTSAMPAQLVGIDVDVCAELGSVVLPLQDLLNLEVGDVLVLETKVGDSIVLTAEGEVRARGELGRRDGKLAVRIRTVERDDSREHKSKTLDGK